MIVYLDTSALVKIYFAEEDSDRVRRAADGKVRLVTSALAGPEMASAMNRRIREGKLTEAQAESVWLDWLQRCRTFIEIPLNSGVDTVLKAVWILSRRHNLRAADAVHLSSALDAARSRFPGESCLFLTADQALKKAAAAEGLRVG